MSEAGQEFERWLRHFFRNSPSGEDAINADVVAIHAAAEEFAEARIRETLVRVREYAIAGNINTLDKARILTAIDAALGEGLYATHGYNPDMSRCCPVSTIPGQVVVEQPKVSNPPPLDVPVTKRQATEKPPEDETEGERLAYLAISEETPNFGPIRENLAKSIDRAIAAEANRVAGGLDALTEFFARNVCLVSLGPDMGDQVDITTIHRAVLVTDIAALTKEGNMTMQIPFNESSSVADSSTDSSKTYPTSNTNH